MSWLYRYEAKGIQSYVLGTHRLVEIAGGSSLVARLPATLKACVGNDAILQQAAGSATVRFSTQQALREFASSWPAVVAQHAPGLQVVQAWVEGSSASSFSRLLQRLAQVRNEQWPELPEATPWMARAARTGLPAVRRDKHLGLLDAGTLARLEEGKTAHDQLADDLLDGEDRGRGFQRHSDDFGSSQLAVVHIDGNDIGRKVIERTSGMGDAIAAYQAFSSHLTNATRAAAKRAVMAVLPDARPSEAGKAIAMRPVVLGGDDLTIILRARDALQFAVAYMRAFEQETGGYTSTAGVAFVKARSPFHMAHHLSEALCKAGKQKLRRKEGTPSSLWFHRIGSTSHASWHEVLQTELRGIPEPGRPVPGALTCGPYTLSETLPPLIELARAARELPRGTLREWVRSAAVDPQLHPSMWKRLLVVQRQQASGPMQKLEAALKALGCAPESPWRGNHTPIPDALMLRALQVQLPEEV